MVYVEPRCYSVDGVDHDDLAPYSSRSLDDDAKGDDKQLATEPLALEITGQSQLRQEHRWNLTRSAAALRLREAFPVNRVRRYREVPDDSPGSVEDDIRPGALARCCPSVQTEPLVEVVVSTVEASEIVVFAERAGEVRHAVRMRGSRRARFAAAAKRGDVSGASSRAATNWSKYCAGTTVEECSPITSSARCTAADTMNADMDSPVNAAARPILSR